MIGIVWWRDIMTLEDKKWIDSSDYEMLLRRWRFAPCDGSDKMFQGDTGDYYKTVMFAKRGLELDGGVQASKNVGWDR